MVFAAGPLRDEILATGVTPIFGFVLPPYQVLGKTRLGAPADWEAQEGRPFGLRLIEIDPAHSTVTMG